MARSEPINTNLTERLALLTPGQQELLKKRFSDQTVSGHELIALSLKKLGVTHIYCVTGIPVHGTLAACSKTGIRIMGVRHQQAAVMMALAQNYVEGRMIAIAIFSPGPAITNAITGILIAKDNCWPILVLGGATPLSMKDMGCFQEFNAVQVMQPVTKWSALISVVEDIPEALENAFKICTSGRFGPVYLEIPEDVLTAKGPRLTFDSVLMCKEEMPCVNLDAIRAAGEVLLSAKRPLIIIGKSIRWTNAREEIRLLIEKYKIPFITSPMGQGYLPDDHIYCFNTDRSYIQQCADVVMIVGARLNWTFRYGSELNSQAKIIQFDADEKELGKNISPLIALSGDIKYILKEFLVRINQIQNQYSQEAPLDSWFGGLAIRRVGRLAKLQQEGIESLTPMSPLTLMKKLRDSLPKDTIYILDGNVCMGAAQKLIPSYFPASRLTAGTNGCMGGGVPFGIGAKLSQPNKPTVVISGDFAFGLNGMKMETAVRYNVPVIVILVNNSGATGALIQNAYYPKDHESVSLFNQDIRYDLMVKAFGGHGEYVRDPDEIVPAIKRSIASDKASLINVMVDPDAPLYSRL
jgi:thiamine pyrophosphate-dependent acetolactate synthase large subunit-like protein